IQPPPVQTRGRLLGAIVGYLALGMVTVVGGVLGGFYLVAQESVKDISAHDALNDMSAHSVGVKRAQAELAKLSQPNQPAVALIIGYDHRKGIESSVPSRSDTIMLVRADPVAKTISLLSFPRDMRVPIHCPGKLPYESKINGAYEACGETGTLETVQALTGVQVNYLITVDFHGFKQIVDHLGGVWIDVDHRYFNDNGGRTTGDTYATINLWPGYQKLNGSQALDYARFRHTDSDLYRVARQQIFVQALKQQAEANFSPARVDAIIGALRRNVEIGIGGGGELDLRTLLKYAHFIYGLPNGHFFRGHINDLVQDSGSSDLLGDPTKIANAVQEFQNPQVDAPAQAAVAARIARAPKKKWTPPPSTTTLIVLNGNGVVGSAGAASSALGLRGYKTIVPPNGQKANAPTFSYFQTEVYYNPAWGPGKLAAPVIAKLFGSARVAPMPPNIAPLAYGARIVVVVGKTFHGTIATGPTTTEIKHVPPKLRPALLETKPVVVAVRKKLHFRLAAPSVLDANSRLDSFVPSRVYPLNHDHKALRLVFKSALDVGGYWGIEESDWPEAPALANPSYTRRLAGRTYDFYLTGAHIHMVVAHGPGNARYWVVNTLLDLISNETMVSIAKGLRVLPR
ncbi:MAG: polyisoprenyl-teichoic acid--peptidoglycan teichoic acid transferase, partial [Gaiellaceae bacterium]|nr:polyisoprenyl-teichoic acid--peptidoglycan teichoic acid transferase [Gaiellaceae bacterium]